MKLIAALTLALGLALTPVALVVAGEEDQLRKDEDPLRHCIISGNNFSGEWQYHYATFCDAEGYYNRVFFESGSEELSEAAERVLDKQMAILIEISPIDVLIEGHTDNKEVSSNRASLELGERRAQAVKAYLTAKGIAADQICTFSYGWHRPVDVGSAPESLAKNRHAVTITIIDYDCIPW